MLHGRERLNGPGGYQSFYAHLWCPDDQTTPTFQRYLHDAFAEELGMTGEERASRADKRSRGTA